MKAYGGLVMQLHTFFNFGTIWRMVKLHTLSSREALVDTDACHRAGLDALVERKTSAPAANETSVFLTSS